MLFFFRAMEEKASGHLQKMKSCDGEERKKKQTHKHTLTHARTHVHTVTNNGRALRKGKRLETAPKRRLWTPKCYRRKQASQACPYVSPSPPPIHLSLIDFSYRFTSVDEISTRRRLRYLARPTRRGPPEQSRTKSHRQSRSKSLLRMPIIFRAPF